MHVLPAMNLNHKSSFYLEIFLCLRARILLNSHTYTLRYVSQEMGSEVQVWHLSIRLKLHHHYMKDFQFFSLSLCVSFVSFLLISFWNTAHPRKKKIRTSNPVMWEKLLPFSVFSFYLVHSPGSNLCSSLPFWKRTPCRNEIHHG